MNNIESYSLSEIIKRYEKDLERSKLGGDKKILEKTFYKKENRWKWRQLFKIKKIFWRV